MHQGSVSIEFGVGAGVLEIIAFQPPSPISIRQGICSDIIQAVSIYTTSGGHLKRPQRSIISNSCSGRVRNVLYIEVMKRGRGGVPIGAKHFRCRPNFAAAD